MTEAKATKAPTTTPVKMDDGTTVEFGTKQRLKKTLIELPDGRLQVRLDFVNGEFRVHTINPALLAKYALHGASQKLGDEISSIEALDDAIEAVDQLMLRLDKGEWTMQGPAGGMAGASLLAKALVEVTGQTIVNVRSYLLQLTPKVKAALIFDPLVKPVFDRLKAERDTKRLASGKGTTATDTASVLGALASLGKAPATDAPQ